MILEVQRLTRHFGGIKALDGVDFRIGQGELSVSIGPNGSGKTVLFRALIGALPFEGLIAWAPGVRIGYVPQKLDIERDVFRHLFKSIRGMSHRYSQPHPAEKRDVVCPIPDADAFLNS